MGWLFYNFNGVFEELVITTFEQENSVILAQRRIFRNVHKKGMISYFAGFYTVGFIIVPNSFHLELTIGFIC